MTSRPAGGGNMATYVEIIRHEFPDIDSELFQYVTGVLDSSAADFESVDEIFEAIGDVLQEVSVSKNKDDVREICQKMFNTLKLNTSNSSKSNVLLKAPIQLSQMTGHADHKTEDVKGIWMMRRDLGTTVDAKKLEKAEARLKAKQEKRTEKNSQKTANPLILEEASASQASNKKESRLEASGKNKSYDIKIENFDVSYGERGDGSESSKLTEIYSKLEEIEADKAPARASVILAGLGFSSKMQQQMTREFSGGWRMRLALARALFAKPDLLLLDEPTNMLDVRAILWLENYLQTWQSTILVVSHDRNFLNAVATDIVHLHSQRLETYRGDYENFVKTKEERLKNQQREYEAQQQYREHIQVFIDRFRYNANRASQVQSKLKLLEKLPELKPLEKELEVTIRFPDNFEKLSPPILQLTEVDFSYSPEHRIFVNLSVSADQDSRICIVGENGAGKTTLLKILLGDLTPVQGIRHAHRNLKIGYFSQHHVDQLEMNVSSVELLASKFPGRPEEEYRHQLGGYGISGDLAVRPVASLSGGQKSRVAFAQMTMAQPNFYILDEPTNHLDMETIEALGNALQKFKGGVILVSHDERLIRMVCKELWVCGCGTVKRVDGGFDEYKDILQEQFRKEGFL
ncbi:ATP-binding cassette sub-family F member 3 isoform X2 [Rhincodon typus]|uniref:ATP-binding cassette sub-family F member 3 isoform X2 n=1 Tax=Rhincodon typus TaxID=259920 RepID=UPI002030B5B8|nr:ATP-binding cassette sub-family F member 3 isoform X2 [Rhincodon typus]